MLYLILKAAISGVTSGLYLGMTAVGPGSG